ncbi:diacylglycerol kinase [Pullulanibacillus pueri]|uniref:Diacylglycerol kinase n=1 Tax=Pullulanibacillus pueri TaxID=1437324 RepID=A0A8J2ZXX8_9BACL|nr:diacylglycerol kinase family protein [Pullulanibacillus pueri]MBM7683040.1 diacylglycerol kinase [Pullulanibacillus pueri]GGH84986.1 diacylglycerol kinase [Pullulanibacillus pueri]
MSQPEFNRSVLARFGYALSGLKHAFKKENHLRFHCFAAVVVFLAALILHVSLADWCLLLLLIALVIITELVNTAIERVVDLVTLEKHPLAKEAKDIAAGAVLVSAAISVVVGSLIFIKYL